MTPAMAAGIADHAWTVRELLEALVPIRAQARSLSRSLSFPSPYSGSAAAQIALTHLRHHDAVKISVSMVWNF
jgi:hypothetical protein